MKRFYIVAVIFMVVSMACITPPWVSSSVSTPTTTPKSTAAKQIKPTATMHEWTTEVVRPYINVRASAGGDPTGKYLRAGDTVTVLSCVDNWCEIEPLPEWEIEAAYVWIGCLDLDSGKGCVTAH